MKRNFKDVAADTSIVWQSTKFFFNFSIFLPKREIMKHRHLINDYI